MKKTAILVAFLIIGSVFYNSAKADLMGFLDGNMYDPSTGTWKCQFLMDGNCYDVNENILATRAPGTLADTSPIVAGNSTVAFPTNPLEPTPQPVQQPTQQTINQPTMTQTINLPAYTEDQLVSVLKCKNGLISLIINITTSSAQFSPCVSGGDSPFNHVTVNFQGQNIFTNGIGQTPYGNRDWAQISGLSADTDYSWTLTYMEPGRDDTIVTKTFHTPNQ